MLRWQRLTGLYLGQPLTEVQQQVHMLAAQSARCTPGRRCGIRRWP